MLKHRVWVPVGDPNPMKFIIMAIIGAVIVLPNWKIFSKAGLSAGASVANGVRQSDLQQEQVCYLLLSSSFILDYPITFIYRTTE